MSLEAAAWGSSAHVQPFSVLIDPGRGIVGSPGPRVERRLSDLADFYQVSAPDSGRDARNPLIYSVDGAAVTEKSGELPFSVSTIESGMVGDQFYMTMGHRHTAPEAELYLGLSGHGVLLLFDGERVSWLEMGTGVAAYVPVGWAHRTVNVDASEQFRFLAVYPGSAGHDYGWVRHHGMGARVVCAPGGYEVITQAGIHVLPPSQFVQPADDGAP